MKKLLSSVALVGLASAASAGGIERSSQSVGFLFDEGDVASIGISSAKPKVSGALATPVPTGPPPAPVLPAGSPSGDMAGDYLSYSLSYKQEMTDKLHVGFVLDESVGADASYPILAYPLAGASAFVDGQAYTGMVRYEVSDRVSVYGGLRVEQVSGGVANLNGYNLSTDKSTETGYLVGAAYEMPDIALRVSLTYNSEITHKLTTTENGFASGTMDVTTPESWHLEFQSGVAEGTLVFGSIKWREWSSFDISPNGFAAANGGASLVNLTNDSLTYNLGVARQVTDQLALIASFEYEKANGGFAGNLTPTDGKRGISLAASYDVTDQVTLRGGVSYIELGDATTVLGGTPPAALTSSFTDNKAIGIGVQMKYKF